jgi:hypothetical protein
MSEKGCLLFAVSVCYLPSAVYYLLLAGWQTLVVVVMVMVMVVVIVMVIIMT